MYVLVLFMSLEPLPVEPENAPDQPTSDQQAQDAQYYRFVLHDLIDMGTELARMVHRQALSQAKATTLSTDPHIDQTSNNATAVLGNEHPPLPSQDLVAAFDRIARAIRRTIVLARKVAMPPPPPGDPARSTNEQHRTSARKRIIREVEDAIQRAARDNEAEALHAEFSERLDAPDLDDDIDHRPAADIIAEICRDLGIAARPGTHPWKRRTPQDVAALSARAAMPRATPRPVAPGKQPLPPPHPPPHPSPTSPAATRRQNRPQAAPAAA
jgi:hypothetical protein